jgi:hypothetical protein
MNARRVDRYLETSHNPEGREQVINLAADLDETCIEDEIRLYRALCVGLTMLIGVVLGARYLV